MIYDAKKNEFLDNSSVPKLNVGRFRHGSCATDDKFFVFGGSKSGGRTNSLEYLQFNINRDENGEVSLTTGPQWTLQEIPELSARTFPLVARAGPLQVLILGGSDRTSA